MHYPKGSPAILNQSPKAFDEMLNHLGAVENNRNEQKARVEPQLLRANSEIFGVGFGSLEVSSAEYGLVEDVGLDEEPALAAPHVLPEIQLSDSARDLTKFPPLQPALYQLRAVLLLVLPEPRVRLEHLLERVVLLLILARAAAIRWHVAYTAELPVRALHQRAEGLQSEVRVLGHACRRMSVCVRDVFRSPSGDARRRRSSENWRKRVVVGK